jgi:hypothetical protein
MIFEGAVDVEVDVISAPDDVSEFQEEDNITLGGVRTGKDGDGTPFEGREEIDEEMTVCGVGHPDVLGEELGEDDGRGFGLDDADGGAGVHQEMEAEETVLDAPEI